MTIRFVSVNRILRFLLIVAFVGAFFGFDAFRLLDGGAIDALILRPVRGFVYAMAHWFVWPVAAMVYIISLRQVRPFSFRWTWPLWLFLWYLGLQLLRTGPSDIALDRVRVFFSYVVPVMVCLVFFTDEKTIMTLRRLFFGMGLISVLSSLANRTGIFGDPSSITRLVIESDPITTASHLLMGAIAGILMAVTPGVPKRNQVMLFAAAGLMVVTALPTGSRGPLLAFALVVLLLIVLYARTVVQRMSLVALLGVGVYLVSMLISGSFPLWANRYFSETGIRSLYYSAALEAPPSLFGIGMGNFYSLSTVAHRGEYVHNSLLEAYVELGVVGLILFVAWVGFTLFGITKVYFRTRNSSALFCLMASLYYFISSQFSGNLLSNRGLYATLWLSALVMAEFARVHRGATSHQIPVAEHPHEPAL